MKTRRRDFLKLAAAGVPLFNIGRAAFGQARARQIAKGAKIRVALIGCGFRMREMILADTSEQVVAMVEPDAPPSARRARDRSRWARRYAWPSSAADSACAR